MSQRSEELITVLDAGSAKTRVFVAELHEGALRYRAHAVVDSEGMRKGLISKIHPASKAFNDAASQAERMADAIIASCVVGIGGPHLRGVNSQGGVTLGTRLREITREDVRAAVDRARSVSLPADREIVHLLPQQFILDEQPGIHDPVGMIGNRLEVNLHISTCSASAAQSVVTCANKAGLEVTDTIFEAIAAAEATVSADERELRRLPDRRWRRLDRVGRLLRRGGGPHRFHSRRRRPLHQRSCGRPARAGARSRISQDPIWQLRGHLCSRSAMNWSWRPANSSRRG